MLSTVSCALVLVALASSSAYAHPPDAPRPQPRLLQDLPASPAAALANFVSRSPGLSQAPNLFAASPREFVSSPDGYQTALGLVVAYQSGSFSYCSGALISPSAVLTASHCFFDTKSKTAFSPSTVKFYPGITRDQRANGKLKSEFGDPYSEQNGAQVTYIHIHPNYQAGINKDPAQFNDAMVKADMAIMNLEKDVIAAEDTFEVVTSCQIRLDSNGDEQDVDALTAGYPKDENSSSNNKQVLGTLVQSFCDVTVANDTDCGDKRLRHQCSILGGNSGGPIFVINRTPQGAQRFKFSKQPALVFAVQSGESSGEGVCNRKDGTLIFADVQQCDNSAAEIDDAAKSLILGWAKGPGT